jgi:hypothetical protein
MRRGLVLAAALVLAAGAVRAEERLVDAEKVFPLLDKFYAMPPAERSLLVVRYNIMRDGKPPADLHVALVVAGRRTPVAVAADGRLERLPTPADFAAHAQVAIDAPAGSKFSNRLSLDTAIPAALEVSPSTCILAISQANAAVRHAVGVMAMLAPKVKAVTFVGAGSGVAVLADGRTVPLPLIAGAPAYDPDAIKGAKAIRLARTPSLISLE